jgi:hypothetical protein
MNSRANGKLERQGFSKAWLQVVDRENVRAETSIRPSLSEQVLLQNSVKMAAGVRRQEAVFPGETRPMLCIGKTPESFGFASPRKDRAIANRQECSMRRNFQGLG